MTTLAILWAAAASAGSPPGDEAAWKEVRNDVVRVECVEVAEEPWCRSHGLVAAPLDQVTATLQDMPAHQDKFEAVASIRQLEPGTLHITLDYPGMFSDRDYVARYTPSIEGGVHWFRWASVTHAAAPPVDGVVRLGRFAGAWRLAADGSHTAVTYLWHADVGGNFPGWATGIARKRAGYEALKDSALANGTSLVEPE